MSDLSNRRKSYFTLNSFIRLKVYYTFTATFTACFLFVALKLQDFLAMAWCRIRFSFLFFCKIEFAIHICLLKHFNVFSRLRSFFHWKTLKIQFDLKLYFCFQISSLMYCFILWKGFSGVLHEEEEDDVETKAVFSYNIFNDRTCLFSYLHKYLKNGIREKCPRIQK